MIEPSSEGFITEIHCPQRTLIPVRAWDSYFLPSPLAIQFKIKTVGKTDTPVISTAHFKI
jgi:hypothetical protein